MPGWPTVDRTDDHALVDALRRAEPGSPAKLYDAYAERLHDYACSLTGDRDTAADAVHDAIVTAQARLERLKDRGRLRAWLYALTRFQAVARLGRGDDDGLPPPVLDDPDDPELAELVHQALGELSRNEREVLELSIRHGLTPVEVGGVLGLTSRQAATRLGRARDHVENAAAAVLLARNGRAHCPDLSAMVDSWEGPLTPLLRRRLAGHIGGCEVCTEGRHRQVSAARLLDMVPVTFPPISLRRRVIDICGDPSMASARSMIVDRGDSFDRAGFPVAPKRRGRRATRSAARTDTPDRPRRGTPDDLAWRGAAEEVSRHGVADDLTLRGAAEDVAWPGAAQDTALRGAADDLTRWGATEDVASRAADDVVRGVHAEEVAGRGERAWTHAAPPVRDDIAWPRAIPPVRDDADWPRTDPPARTETEWGQDTAAWSPAQDTGAWAQGGAPQVE
ncbi:MAG: sigma-70 family RNA polymerase sigma factor, partial [Nonomuraea sp.]|nr:sigma-70 family RNA polymerase sigma factor [Nonomuraea sp.]